MTFCRLRHAGTGPVPLRVNAAALDQWNGGSAPVAECRTEGAVRQRYCPPGTSRKARPGQPVVSYVGYSLKEPWGEPRVVIGIDADEAEYLAEFLDRDECAQRGQVPLQQATVPQVPQQLGPLQSGSLQQVKLTEPAPEGTSALRSTPVALGRGRQSPDQARDRARELAGWTSGELPGQVTEQLTSWPPGMPSAADQPPASAFHLISGFTAAS